MLVKPARLRGAVNLLDSDHTTIRRSRKEHKATREESSMKHSLFGIGGAAVLSCLSSVAAYAHPTTATAMDSTFGLPKPPVDLSYSFTNSLSASIGSVICFLVVVIVAAINARKTGKVLPLFVAASGILFSVVEVIIDIPGACYWAVDNSQVVFTILGRPMTWMPICSWLAFGAIQIYAFYSLLAKNASTKSLWICYGLMCVLDIVLEEIELRVPGIYTYYGNQPFVFFLFPAWWMFVNAAGCFSSAALIHRFEEHLQGWKAFGVFLLAPLGYLASFAFTSVPAVIVVNGTYSWLTTQLGGLMTVLLSVLCMGLTMSVILNRYPLRGHSNSSDRMSLRAAVLR